MKDKQILKTWRKKDMVSCMCGLLGVVKDMQAVQGQVVDILNRSSDTTGRIIDAEKNITDIIRDLSDRVEELEEERGMI